MQFNPNGLGSFEVVVGHPMGWRMDSVDVGEVRIQSDNAAIVPFLEIQHQYNVALNDPGLEYVRRALADPTPFALVLLSCNEYDPSDKCRVLAVVATRFSASP
ncbi:MAG: hypothetical protein F4Z35_03095 [Dehalococcoidia bacterium]|nr:hypothetical protein [Dehalococcoidia bacterium]